MHSETCLPAGLEVAGQLRSNETILVTAAAGGTGQFVVQLAKAAGAHVIALCGSPAKAAMLRGLGADRVVNYKSDDLDAILKAEYPKASSKVECSLTATARAACF